MTMSSRTIRMSLGALAAAAVVTFGGTAHASFYDSDFDPFFFSGTARFQVADNCLSSNGEHFANVVGCSPVDMEASPTPTIFLDDGLGHTTTLNFTGFTTDSADMVKLAVIGNTFVGIDTNKIGGFAAVNPTFFPGFYFFQFQYVPHYSSSFLTTDSPIAFGSLGTLISVDNSVLLFGCALNNSSDPSCTLKDTAFNVTFTRVAAAPEPGTLGLLLGAVGAGWWARRRKAAV